MSDSNNPKGGAFIIQDSNPEHVYIPGEINEEQKMIIQMCREFLDQEVLPIVDRIDQKEEGLMESLLEKAGELGLLGTAIPEEYGGFGKDFNTNAFLAEILGEGNSFPVSLMAHTGIGTLPILYFGTDDQRQKYLPGLATGEKKACYCLTEPGSGSDALAARTKAELSEDGKYYKLNGQKMWITNAGFADVFVVFAQITGDNVPEDQQGFSAFIIEREMEGLSVGEEEHKMGIQGSSTCPVFLENCKVPVENLLGTAGKGHLIAFNILNIGRFKLAAATLGGAKRSCAEAVKYANERIQFKVPIASFGAIKHKMAEMAIRIFSSESALYRTSNYIALKEEELIGTGMPHGDALLGAAKEYAVECAIMKVFGSEVLDFVVDEGVQIFGGYGFSEEYPMARAYRDSRINRIFEGTNEINRLLIVDMLLKSAMKGELDLLNAAKAVQGELMAIPDFNTDEPQGFDAEIKAVSEMKKATLLVAGAAAQKLMMSLAEEQEILMNIADMVILTYVNESNLLRCMRLEAIKAGEDHSAQQAMMRVFLSDSMHAMNKAGRDAIASFAEGDEARMINLGIKRFTKCGPVNVKELRRLVADKMIEAGNYPY